MSKKIAIIVLCFFLFILVSCNTNQEKIHPASLVISSAPLKTEYYDGEEFDQTGLVVLCVYSDGTSEEIQDYGIDKTVLHEGDNFVSVSYNGLTVKQPVQVNHAPRLLKEQIVESGGKTQKITYFYEGFLLTETDQYNSENVLTSKTLYEYEGTLLCKETTLSYKEGEVYATITNEYSYNVQGLKEKELSFTQIAGADFSNSLIVLYEYDLQGRPIKSTSRNGADGSLKSEMIFSYDDTKLTCTRTYRNYEYHYTAMTVDSYNLSGAVVKSAPIGSAGNTTFYEYDESGNLILETVCDPTEVAITKHEYRYDEQNYLLEERYFDCTQEIYFQTISYLYYD